MKKLLTATSVAVVLGLCASNAIADSVDVDSTVEVTATAISTTVLKQLNFGSFEITNASASGTIAIDTSNQATANITDGIYNDGHNWGAVKISGTPGASFNVTCSSTATLAHESNSGDTMPVTNVFVGGGDCAGTFVKTFPQDGILTQNITGNLSFSNPAVGTYSSANAGGVPITVNMVYQ